MSKINNIPVTAVEFNNALATIKYILLNNKATWPTVSCDCQDVYLVYDIDPENIFGYTEETRLRDNASITCGHKAGCFWTSYEE